MHRSTCSRTGWLCALAAIGACSPRLSAEPAKPIFWAWEEPLGDAAGNPKIIQMLRNYADSLAGDEFADWVLGEIDARELTADQVCIMPQNFGYGEADGSPPPLLRHEDDGVGDQGLVNWNYTPWATHGVANASDWVAAFIDRYQKAQQDDPSIPDPTRFHFDTEAYVVFWDDGGTSSTHHQMNLFYRMQHSEARWSSEELYGWPGQTLDDLFSAASGSVQAYDKTYAMWDSINQPFTLWYIGLTNQVLDGAMAEAAYSQIDSAWTGVKCSNYWTSLKYDGGGSPAREYIDNWSTWGHVVFEGSADLQASMNYSASDDVKQGGESLWDASLRINRLNIENAINSFGGGHQAEQAAWVPIANQVFSAPNTSNYTVTKDDLRRLFAMLRSLGVEEYMIWCDNTYSTSTNWNQTNSAIDQVWGGTLTSVVGITNFCNSDSSQTRLDKCTLADADKLVLATNGGCGNYTGSSTHTLEVEFDTSYASAPDKLGVVLESIASTSGITVTLKLKNWNGGFNVFDTIGSSQSVGTSGHGQVRWVDGSASAHINSSSHKVRAKFEFASTGDYSVSVDLAQLVALDSGSSFITAPPGPGGPSWMARLAHILNALGSSGTADTAADLNGDGRVDIRDLAAALVAPDRE